MKMTKAATKTAETAEFPTFDPSQATEQFRVFAEQGVEQSKEAYAKVKTGMEDAQKVWESTFETAKTAAGDLSLKSISAMRAGAEANLAHMEALVGVKSLSEVLELQTAFMRKSYEMMVEQAKDMQAAGTKAAESVAKPAKTAFEKAVKEFQVA
ncbi:phasin [Mesorhizobium sp. Z1-4]|uniref:phasin n=1 Tax=Mesorhizobium sp. Z1-4 TaxID=2448478 RepID=UPI000FD994E9|nr:phasin [Mesorhizobium sp. Z1-4]